MGAALLAVALGVLPWATIGQRTRSGYSLARAVWGAGLADERGLLAVSLLPLVPLVAVGGLGLLQIRRGRMAATVLVASAGLVVALAALVVRRAPVQAEPGTAVALVGGILVGAVAAGVAVQQQRSRA